MQKIFTVLLVLSSGIAQAAVKIGCHVNYTSVQGVQTGSEVKDLELSPFTYQLYTFGNLCLQIGLGGTATLASGETNPTVSVDVVSRFSPAPLASDFVIKPQVSAQVDYEQTVNQEALIATCSYVIE